VPTKGLAIVHTTTATGEMKVLASGDFSVTVLAMAYDRVIIDDARIAGVAVGTDRLYVLKWQGRAGGIIPHGVSFPDTGTYRLLVFRPQDGKLIASADLKGDGMPKGAPTVTAEQGPLRLHDLGVSCFGRRFELRGTELIEQVPERRR
jgi:hypothetical protein